MNWRRLAAHTLLVLGLVIAGAGLIVAYLARTVLNERAFSARLVQSLDRPRVAAFVSDQIADGVIAANRDLTGVKPVIATLAEGLVRSAPFRAIARKGAEEAHHVAFSEETERVMLAVPDVGVMLRSTLQAVNPEIASRIPPQLHTVSTELTGTLASRALTAMRTLHRVRAFARWGLGVGLLLIVGGIALSPVRRQTLLNAGIGLVAIAVLLALLVPLGRALVTSAVRDPALRPVAGDVWLTFADGLLPWAIGVAAAALMVMAAVAAFLAPAQLRQLLALAWGQARARREQRLHEVVRIAVLFALGAVAVMHPVDTAASVVVVLGLGVLASATYALVSLVAPDVLHAGTMAAGEPLRLSPAAPVAAGTVVAMALALGLAALVPRLRPAPAPVAGPVVACNGFTALCDRPFNEVVLAGAHNAMGSSDDPHWLFPNQDASIRRLLDKGVRALLVDVMRGHPVGDEIKTDFETEDQRRKFEAAIGPEAFAAAMRVRDRLIGEGGEVGLYVCHGFCELGAQPFDTVLVHIRDFLEANPGEVVLVVLEDRAPPADIVAAIERMELGPFVYRGPWHAPFPTLGEMVASGQRLMVLGENVPDTTSWYRPAYSLMQETPYTFHKPGDFSCRPNRGSAGNPLFLMNHWIETTPAPKPSNATLVNTEAVLVDRARECRRVRGHLPTVLAVDFAATGDVVRAAEVLNGLVEPAPRTAADSARARAGHP